MRIFFCGVPNVGVEGGATLEKAEGPVYPDIFTAVESIYL